MATLRLENSPSPTHILIIFLIPLWVCFRRRINRLPQLRRSSLNNLQRTQLDPPACHVFPNSLSRLSFGHHAVWYHYRLAKGCLRLAVVAASLDSLCISGDFLREAVPWAVHHILFLIGISVYYSHQIVILESLAKNWGLFLNRNIRLLSRKSYLDLVRS